MTTQKPITLGEAALPLTLQVWDTGAMTLCDSRGYFVLSVAPEHAARLAQLFLPAVLDTHMTPHFGDHP